MKKQRNSYDYQKNRALERKNHLFNLRGGKCEICGYKKNLAAIDFHHSDQSKKEMVLDGRKLSNSTMNSILLEFEKCVVMCANCHREHHNPIMEIDEVNKRLLEFNCSDENKNCLILKRKVNKPKCCDCGVEINYSCKRCVSCKCKKERKVERPNLIELRKEVDAESYSWCARKYKVSDKTIKKWLTKNIQ